jgi:hypothetical protein
MTTFSDELENGLEALGGEDDMKDEDIQKIDIILSCFNDFTVEEWNHVIQMGKNWKQAKKQELN